ncbi:MAG: type II toxin-antitoxin system VapC family toxin [Balneolales bacterium]
MNDVLIDTNILVYAIDKGSSFHELTLNYLLNEEINLFTTSKNLSELLAVLTKKSAFNFPVYKALQFIEEVIDLMIILYPTDESFALFMSLIHKYEPRGSKVHDYEIASIGMAHSINTIFTGDRGDFKNIKELYIIDL